MVYSATELVYSMVYCGVDLGAHTRGHVYFGDPELGAHARVRDHTYLLWI